MGASTERYELLDAMRGVAALAVVGCHARYFFSPVPFFESGYLAVDVFFLLSGFVIAHAYDRQLAGGRGVRWFLQKRVIRLWPLLSLGLVVGVITTVVLHRVTPGRAVQAFGWGFLALPAFGGPGSSPYPLNGALWSLTFEMIANIIFAVFHRQLTTRVLVVIAAVGALALAGLTFEAGSARLGYTWETFAGGFARVGFAFPAGVLLYRHRDLIPAALGRVGPWAALLILAALLCAAPARGLAPWYDLAVIFVAAPALVAVGASNSGRVWAPLGTLGAVSYALYATHHPFIYLAASFRKATEIPGPLVGIALIGGCLVLAWGADRWDAVVRGWLARIWFSPGAIRQSQ